ncbi:hypothetical protein MRX96_038176 [Rhipicephalus microplus]
MEKKLPVDSKTEKAQKIADKPGKQRDKRKEEIGVESVKDKQTSDKQAAANQQELSPPAPAAPTRTAVVAFVTVSVLSCILVLSSTLLILQYLRAPIVGTCTTAGCIAQAEAIPQCHECFGEAVFRLLPLLVRLVEAPSVTTRVAPPNGPTTLLQSEIQKFAKFKRDLGLLWPEEWPEKSNVAMPPLKVLVNLTVNWNVNLIFNVRVIPGYKGRPRSIFLQRGVLGPSWSVYKPDEMKRSIEEHCQFLRAQAPTPVLLKEIMKAYLAVVNASLSFEPDARDEEKTTLKEINERTESGKDKWEEYMKETLPDFVWRPEDVVLIQHPAILDNIGHLLESMSDKSLRLGIAWVFVYLTFWTVVGKPHLLFEGSAEELEVREKYACLSHVASTFGLVVSHDHLLKRFTDDVRLHIDTVFKTIKAAYQRAFADADWIDESVKTKLKAKVSESLTLNSLPGSEFFSNFAIAAVYKHFPNATSSFFDNFVNIAKSFRKKLSSDDFVNAFSKTLGDGHVATSTFSSTYGSMGTLMASSMARAFDERGIVFDRGEVAPWWIADRKEYERRLKCDLGAGRSRSDSGAAFASPLFWAALGLRTSYDAYRSAIKVRKTVDIFRIKGLEKYSDDQVFFMSYCLITCAIDSNGDACNIPVRQSSKFAVAFRCPEKAPMNPRERCPFL